MENNPKMGASIIQKKIYKGEKRETKYTRLNIRVHPENGQVGRNG